MTERQALHLHWAQHPADRVAAQRLRHAVFVQEMGARPSLPRGTPPGLEADLYDPFCEHLLVRAGGPEGEVVATYRMLLPPGARQLGALYAEERFDLTRLRAQRAGLAELGRACVHPAYRRGAALMLMWRALAQRLAREPVHTLIGSVSLPAQDGGAQAWALWQSLAPQHLAPLHGQVRSRFPLPRPLRPMASAPEVPPLLRAYLKLNAQLLGEPAWDASFRCVDLPVLVRLDDLPARWRLGQDEAQAA